MTYTPMEKEPKSPLLLDDLSTLWHLQQLAEQAVHLTPIPLPRWYAIDS